MVLKERDESESGATPRRAPWVLLRGLTREAGHWGVFVPMLREAAAPREVITPDLPGNGALWQQPSPRSVPAMMEAVRLQLAADGARPPYRLCAMSLGAMVCVAWAHAYPDEVEACVLINTSLRPFSPWDDRLLPRSWPVLARVLLPGSSAKEREAWVLQLTSNRQMDSAERQGLLDEWAALREHHPVSRSNAIRQLMAAATWRAPRVAPTQRMLLLGTLGDGLVSPRCSEALAGRWQLSLRQHGSAGHDLPLDDPAWVVREIAAWAA